MTSQNKARKTATLFWPAFESLPNEPWGSDSVQKHAVHPQDTSAAETAEIDEMSSEPYYINDADSLSGFLEDDPYPIQGELEKLELMDNTTEAAPMEEEGEEVEPPPAPAARGPVEPLYNQIQALMYGMNQSKINHRAALDLARKHPADPVMIAVQALLHRDDATANRLWTKANQLGISSRVEHGCGFVQALVGKMLEDGVGGVVKDSRGAEFWYTRAARNGHAAAQFFLGQFHVKACQYDKARYWLEKAAKEGHARAQMHFGLLFEHGRVGMRGRRDFIRAKEWYQKATDQGDAKAACRLGFIVRKKNHQGGLVEVEYLAAISEKKQPPEAETAVTTTSFAITNEPEHPQAFMGQDKKVSSVQTPTNDEPILPENTDDVLAVKNLWLEEQGSSKKRRLETTCMGPSLAGANDSASSLDEKVDMMTDDHTLPFLKSTELSVAMASTPKRYSVSGDGMKESNSKLYVQIESLLYGMNSIKVDQQAALELAQQHPADPVMICIQAMLQREESAASVLWQKANELGISSLVELGGGLVQALVGKMLENGLGGVKENLRRAEFWYNQAAKKGHATAQCFLGLFHVKDGAYELAKFWLERAAKQGHARAQMHFGLLYEHSHDFETAKFWYKRAVAQGDAKAKYRLDFVEGKMRQRTLANRSGDLTSPMSTLPASVDSVSLSDAGNGSELLNADPPRSLASTNAEQESALRDSKRYKASDESNPVQDPDMRPISQPEHQINRDVNLSNRGFASSVAVGSGQPMHVKEGIIFGSLSDTTMSEILEPDVIRPFCAVMGDKSTRGARLTTGTKVLREIKEWYKESKTAYQESGRDSLLFEEALQRYFTKMATLYRDFPTDRRAREQTLLVKCTKKSLESDRVEKANCFRYSGDKHCQYGTAKLPHAVLFFFDSRDPPKLDAEVVRYRRKLGARPDIQGKGRDYFQNYLAFCADTASRAADGCPTAQLALESTNFIPALKKLWDEIERTSGN